MLRRFSRKWATPLAQHVTLSLIVVVLLFCLTGLARAEPVREVVIKVQGMFCPFCTFGIEKRLKLLPETASVRTDLAAGEAVVTLTPGAAFVEDHFSDAIERAGFTHAGITLHEPPAETEPPAPDISALPQTEISPPQGDSGFTYHRTIGSLGQSPGQFQQPMSMAFAADGSFVVTDAGNARVQQFSADGRPWRQWSISGDGKTPLKKPVGVAVSANEDIWVSDYDADTISHYGPDGTPRGMFGKAGNETGQLDAPSGLTLTSDGLLAVANFYNHNIQLFQPSGVFVRALGVQGEERRSNPAGLNYPTQVTTSTNGHLWVADAYNYRVVAFNNAGTLTQRFGKLGRGTGEFNVSAGLTELSGNRLVVADFLNHRLQLWTTNGTFLADFGRQGTGPGEFERPIDVALSPNGALYVVDWGNSRIQVFTQKGAAQ